MSTMGSPIFVKLEAHTIAHALVDNFNDNVTLQAVESSNGKLHDSWVLSYNGKPSGPDTNIVSMYNGVGAFTVDALEPETLTLSIISESGEGDGAFTLNQKLEQALPH